MNEIKAQVIERLPNALYKVSYQSVSPVDNKPVSKECICYLAGKMRVNKIGVQVGDWVRVILDQYGGKTTNRIIKRY